MQTLACILAVVILGAKALRQYDQQPVFGQASISALQQALAQTFRQCRRSGDIEAQLDRSGDLVDVLATGTAGTHEAFLQLVFLDDDGGRDSEHEAAVDRGRAF